MQVDILNLLNFKVGHIAENEHDFQIKVETNSPPSHCPHCGCVANFCKHDNREQLCTDLPIHGKRVGLIIKRQRYRCRNCKHTFWERLDHTIDEKRNCTKWLLKYIEKQSLKRTFVSISEGVWLNEKTIRNIFRDCINRLEETIRFKTFRILLILICLLYILEEEPLVLAIQSRQNPADGCVCTACNQHLGGKHVRI